MPCWEETGIKEDETKQQYRTRIYAMTRECDLDGLCVQLFGVVHDDWALLGRYGKNDLEQLKAEATALVLASPHYDNQYPLNAFYNDANDNASWNDQEEYYVWEDPDGNFIDFPDEYIDAMDDQRTDVMDEQ